MINVNTKNKNVDKKILADINDYLSGALQFVGLKGMKTREYIIDQFARDVIDDHARHPEDTMNTIRTRSAELKKEAGKHSLRTKIQFKVGSEIQKSVKHGPGLKPDDTSSVLHAATNSVLVGSGEELIPGMKEVAYGFTSAMVVAPIAYGAPQIGIPLAAAIGTGLALSFSRKMVDLATYSWTDKKEAEIKDYILIKQKLWALKTLKKALTSEQKDKAEAGKGSEKAAVKAAVARTLTSGR